MVASSSEKDPVEANQEIDSVDNETLMNCVQNYHCIHIYTIKVPLKKRNA